MSNAKKYILTSITLGLIAASGALLIAGTNMLTRGPIAKNEEKKINSGIATIFDGYSNIFVKDQEDIEKTKDNKFVDHIYYVYDGDPEDETPDTFVGVAIRTSGSNDYGKISLIIGFTPDAVYKNLSVITNEQSFASTLKNKYLAPLINGERDLQDVSCGATYGATTVKDMVNNAMDIAKVKIPAYLGGSSNG